MLRRVLILCALLGLPFTAFAQTYTTSPPPFLLAQNNSGAIINNACIWTYVAGTTTAATTYSDAAGTPNANPIRSDSAGRFTAFLAPGNSYKFVFESACTPPAHGTTLKTADNISAMPPSGTNIDITGTAGETIAAGASVYLSDGSGGKTAGQWFNADADFNYASSLPQVGIAVSAVTSGSSGSFRIQGRVTGLASLTVGSTYYVSATAGALTATSSATARFVGVADSTTSLVLTPNPMTASALMRTFRVNFATPYNLTWPAADAAGVLASDGAGALSYKTMYVVFASRSNVGVAAGVTTYYGSAYDSTTETDSKFPVPVPGTIKNLYVQLDGAPGGSDTFIFTIRKNAADQAVTCTVSAAALTCNNTANSFTVVAGDLLSVKLVTSATASTRKATLSYTLVPS